MNNSSYPVKEVGQIVLLVANGHMRTLLDALYLPRILKNALLVLALDKIG